ncbi:MAG: alpha/beta fold hydrolase [Acetobacteraceae bacterium]
MRRRFVDLPWGQVHLLDGGRADAPPLVMLHGAGSSGAALRRLGQALAETRRVILPDLPGCGDSDPLPDAEPEIDRFASVLLDALEAHGILRCDIHGGHLGARVAIEAALIAPERVRALILDGMGFYDDASRAAMLAHVAPEIAPDPDGAYLARAFQMCRDYFLFFPWFARDADHRRPTGLPAPEAIHTKLVEVLRNGRSYGAAYRAALRYPLEERLPLVRVPLLLTAARTDNVHPQLARAAALRPDAPVTDTPGSTTPGTLAETARIFSAFLDAPGPNRSTPTTQEVTS